MKEIKKAYQADLLASAHTSPCRLAKGCKSLVAVAEIADVSPTAVDGGLALADLRTA